MKTIFWNVDTQYDFIRADGKLPIPDAQSIEGNLARLTLLAEMQDTQVVNTADWHNLNSEEISGEPDFMKTFPPHCLKYSSGAEFIPATKPVDPYTIDWEENVLDRDEIIGRRNIVIYKDRFDVFSGNLKTNDIVETINPDRVVVYGVATNVCVDYAVKGLLERGMGVYVPTDAIKELPNLPLPMSEWVERGAVLLRTNDAYKLLEERI